MRITFRTVVHLSAIAALCAAGCGGSSSSPSCPASCPENAHCDLATAACACDDNFYGEPGACEKTTTCFVGLCRRGTCDDSSGLAVCNCAPHATGTKCDTCEPGYVAYMDGCVLNPCSATTCGDTENGTCGVGPGPAAVCSCAVPYAGDHCERCAEGFLEISSAPLRCVRGDCHENTCNGHGTCSLDPSGLAVCACETGWAYPFCKYRKIESCQLAAPTEQSIAVGGSFQVLADVFVADGTAGVGALAGLKAKACFAHPSIALDPNSPVNLGVLLCWPATFLQDAGNADRYVAASDATHALAETTGTSTTYQYVFGVSSDDGATWTVCDKVGISVDSVSPGTVTVSH